VPSNAQLMSDWLTVEWAIVYDSLEVSITLSKWFFISSLAFEEREIAN
jgi:hypothetical protein